jgi:hypothetical protein
LAPAPLVSRFEKSKENMKIAVVFVHGFTGGTGTWRNGAGQTFKDLLNNDPALSATYDFFEFDYFSKLTDFFNSAPIQKILSKIYFLRHLPGVNGKVKKNKPIAQLSEQFATYLDLVLQEYSDVVLIAHSMGGLIVKDHILAYQTGHGPKPIGYISMAVPHKGSLSALLLSPTNNVNVAELILLSEYSDALNNNWVAQKNNLPPCLYVIAQHDECVSKESAVPFIVPKSDRATLDHDHSSVCKPDSVADLSFVAVSTFLKKISYQKQMVALAGPSPLGSTPDYDKEIFVLKMMVCEIGKHGISDAKNCYFSAEIISKAANRNDAEELRVLQSKVLSLYKQKYNACQGKSLSANDVFAEVHSEITAQDSGVLKSSVVYLNFLHKKGLLHQLANDMGEEVIWSDDTDFEKISSEAK